MKNNKKNYIYQLINLILMIFWVLFGPGYYYFLNHPVPWFQNYTLLVLVVLSIICIVILFILNKYSFSSRRLFSLVCFYCFTILFPLHNEIFNNTTIRRIDGSYAQVGFDLWKAGLTDDAKDFLSKNQSINTKEGLMQVISYAGKDGKLDLSIEKGWTTWSINLAKISLSLTFILSYLSWSLGLSLALMSLIKK